MTAFMPMFNEGAADTSITVKEMYFAETFPEFSRTNTRRATRNAGLELPPVDAEMIDLYLRYFIESGFLTPPAHDGEPHVGTAGPGNDPVAEPPGETIRKLVKQLQPDVTAHVRGNTLYAVAMDDNLGIEHLRRLIAGELHAQPAEIAAFTCLADRLQDGAAQQLFRATAAALSAARPALQAAARSLDLTEEGTDRPQPPDGAQKFAEFITWLGLHAQPGAAASALRADLMQWCALCAELACALRRLGSGDSTAVPAPVLQYVEAYDQVPPQVMTACADVIADAVCGGEDPSAIARVTDRVAPALDAYWRSVATP